MATYEDSFSYRNANLSLWQSAVGAHIRARHQKSGELAAKVSSDGASKLATEKELMAPVHFVANTIKIAGKPLGFLFHEARKGVLDLKSIFDPLADCAKTAANFLKAEVEGNQQASQLYEGELRKAVCDVAGWTECLTTYLEYKALLQSPLYRPNQNVVVDLKTTSKLAIIGDWGTGEDVAINVLEQVAAQKPDLLIHLGDVYYAGTQNEAKTNFLDICRSVLGDIPLYTLCGNHDMYSGGKGYYWLLDQIGQKSSYFCLQNDDWMMLAMDTGFNDRDPFSVSTNMTKLVSTDGWSEASWHLDQISKLGNRKLVLLSHHQLFSPFGPVGFVNDAPYAYNPNLYNTFASALPKVEWWFWGHEHTLGAFASYMGLKRGRCLGASAVPVFTDQQSYVTAQALETLGGISMPTWDSDRVLGTSNQIYNNSFAVMTLSGSSATVEYYEVPILRPAQKYVSTDVEPSQA